MIFRFAPSEFRRQYVVAEDRADAETKRGSCWVAFFDECLSDMFFEPLDVFDREDLAVRRALFDKGFDAMDSAELTFIDSHY